MQYIAHDKVLPQKTAIFDDEVIVCSCTHFMITSLLNRITNSGHIHLCVKFVNHVMRYKLKCCTLNMFYLYIDDLLLFINL